MTKTEKHKEINRAVINYIKEHYPKLLIEEGDSGHLVIHNPLSLGWDDSIEYRRSSHTFCTLNWADSEMKRIEKELETYVNSLMRMYELG